MNARSIPLAALAVAVFVSTADAQQQAQPPEQQPPQQPAAAMPAVPPPTCVAPDLPQKFADSRRIERFNREYKVYGACVNKYIDDTNALATAALQSGKVALDKLNALNDELKQTQSTK
jgi:hypothetical protein